MITGGAFSAGTPQDPEVMESALQYLRELEVPEEQHHIDQASSNSSKGDYDDEAESEEDLPDPATLMGMPTPANDTEEISEEHFTKILLIFQEFSPDLLGKLVFKSIYLV